jgi:putative endonuclease
MATRRTYQDGLGAEALARLFLRLKGYRILASRWRTPVGEIDILARRGRNLVIVEVKYRRDIESALACVSYSQKQRLERAMRYVIAARPHYMNFTWRYDLLAVAPWRWPRHIISAWEGR